MMENTEQVHNFLPPEMTIPAYASLVGLSVATIRKHVFEGILPSVKRGKRRMINIAKIYQENVNK